MTLLFGEGYEHGPRCSKNRSMSECILPRVRTLPIKTEILTNFGFYYIRIKKDEVQGKYESIKRELKTKPILYMSDKTYTVYELILKTRVGGIVCLL